MRLTTAALALALDLVGSPKEAWAQSAPPVLTPGAQGPVIVNQSGQPYTQNIGNGTQQVRATVDTSERGLNIPFTSLLNVDPNIQTRSQVVIDRVGGLFVFGTVGTNTARYGFETGGGIIVNGNRSTFPESSFTDSYAYRLFETTQTNSVTIGGGITAVVRAGGVQRASATATSAAAAQSQALSQIGTLALPGRRLNAVVTSSGVAESSVETRTSAITARDTYVATIVTFGPATIIIGAQGRCQQFVSSCQGGLTYAVGDDETNFNTYRLEDVYVTTTVTRTTTASGTILIDIPFAAYGRAHAGVQPVAFDLSERFLARMLRGDDARLGAGIGSGGNVTLFLEGTAAGADYRASGPIAASHAASEGLRGGIAVRASDELTLGLAGEGGRWRWTLADPQLPESAHDNLWRLGGFAAWSPGVWRVTAGVFGGKQRVTSSAASTLGGGSSAAHYSASTWGAGLDIGRAIPVSGWTLTPSLGIDWLGWRAPAFRESGGLAPLSVAASARDQWRSHLGLAADYQSGRFGFGTFARGTLVRGDRQGLVSASDVATPGGFTILGGASDRHQAEMGAHLDFALFPSATLSVSGNARIGSVSTEYGGQVGLRVAM